MVDHCRPPQLARVTLELGSLPALGTVEKNVIYDYANMCIFHLLQNITLSKQNSIIYQYLHHEGVVINVIQESKHARWFNSAGLS